MTRRVRYSLLLFLCLVATFQLLFYFVRHGSRFAMPAQDSEPASTFEFFVVYPFTVLGLLSFHCWAGVAFALEPLSQWGMPEWSIRLAAQVMVALVITFLSWSLATGFFRRGNQRVQRTDAAEARTGRRER